MSNNILFDRHESLAVITINRPEKMNSLDFESNDELVDTWKVFNDDDSLLVAVVTGSGAAAFCAGADLKTYSRNFATRPAPEFRQKYTNGPGFGGITRGMEIFKPIIAAVNGHAISGGLELALAADLRFCSPNAEFALQDAKWGFHACDGGLIRLPQIVGLGNAMEIILSGDRIDANHALRIGLVNRVIPSEELMEFCIDYGHKLASRSPLSHRFAKEVIKRSVGLPLDEALRMESRSFYDLGASQDMLEGTTAFKEKREAKFSGM